MLINLSDVLSEQHKTVDQMAELEMDVFRSKGGSFPIVKKTPVHVVAEHVKGRELLIHVDTRISVLIPCDRCLEDVEQEFPGGGCMRRSELKGVSFLSRGDEMF